MSTETTIYCSERIDNPVMMAQHMASYQFDQRFSRPPKESKPSPVRVVQDGLYVRNVRTKDGYRTVKVNARRLRNARQRWAMSPLEATEARIILGNMVIDTGVSADLQQAETSEPNVVNANPWTLNVRSLKPSSVDGNVLIEPEEFHFKRYVDFVAKLRAAAIAENQGTAIRLMPSVRPRELPPAIKPADMKPTEMRLTAKVIEISGNRCECWLRLDNGVRIRTSIENPSLSALKLSKDSEFRWLPGSQRAEPLFEQEALEKQREKIERLKNELNESRKQPRRLKK